jgi:hypothetical protein
MARRHSTKEREIGRLLLHIKGLVFVRALLEANGASEAEIAEHSAELERERERLAQLVRAATSHQTRRRPSPHLHPRQREVEPVPGN